MCQLTVLHPGNETLRDEGRLLLECSYLADRVCQPLIVLEYNDSNEYLMHFAFAEPCSAPEVDLQRHAISLAFCRVVPRS